MAQTACSHSGSLRSAQRIQNAGATCHSACVIKRLSGRNDVGVSENCGSKDLPLGSLSSGHSHNKPCQRNQREAEKECNALPLNIQSPQNPKPQNPASRRVLKLAHLGWSSSWAKIRRICRLCGYTTPPPKKKLRTLEHSKNL